MTSTTLFQIFLLADVFIMGVLACTALQHAYAHFRPSQPQKLKSHPTPAAEQLPAAAKEHLLQASQAQFQTVLNDSADQLQQDLKLTAEQINNLVGRLATEIVGDELERYRLDLTKLHNQAETEMSGIQQVLAQHQKEFKDKIAQEMVDEKQRLINQIDTKLADAVGSFLIETLQHNIDLGSQSAYLVDVLEEHKADFIKEVTEDA